MHVRHLARRNKCGDRHFTQKTKVQSGTKLCKVQNWCKASQSVNEIIKHAGTSITSSSSAGHNYGGLVGTHNTC